MYPTSFSGLTVLCLAVSTAVSALPLSDVETRQDTSCAAVHIFLAKGWNETYPGRQGKLAGAICYGLESCDYEDILFYNAPEADYCASITEGNNNGHAQMSEYASRCPDSQLVLSGYSQGANVAGDLLGGGGGSFGDQACTVDTTAGFDPTTSPGNKLAAVLLFGDNRHVANQPYNILSGAPYSAANPRSAEQVQHMNLFAPIIHSYCVETDPVCAADSPVTADVETHLNYFDIYSDEAAGWVKWMLENPQM
ncbi:hypothetical protein LTR05_004060 [Lithohypha guttulata]|uniref:Cutinase n=1 Tax=Lithohypha guttulata TaxID=1690604 RepID=A0AAN7Y7G3_9EURO|nr:hypothetical protein LTR05_004060 [Lithohypha guttulata]